MPIRASERARYPKAWKAISLRIRERDGNRCKWCGAPNGQRIDRITPADALGARGHWRLHICDGECAGEGCTGTRVVLTVAHLDHTPENCADENLVALCQRCHLTYDAKHHASNARRTRAEKRGQTSLKGLA